MQVSVLCPVHDTNPALLRAAAASVLSDPSGAEDAGGSVQPAYAEFAVLMLANLNSVARDYPARQKVHDNHLAWYLVEQLPFLIAADYRRQFGSVTS